ncbi:hypothetical protein B0O80DRAFT_454973 [Mortierella sp. GBAus27b]|nr:hypothetical protein BGX31_009154 [Mortierella sp. GBA43]KAI8351904.1 hypothetical protein B0O80DRAFT_454973 [Mortierella sp. GBAus27b]
MASTSASASAVPSPLQSILDVPELIEMVAQCLSPREIMECMATSKAFSRLFEPFLWRNVVLEHPLPEPSILIRNRHHIRSLSVGCYDYTALSTIADGLPDPIFLSGAGTSNASDNPSPVDNGILPRLRYIHIDACEAGEDMEWQQKSTCLDFILRILNQSPNLTHVTVPGLFLDHRHPLVHAQGFLHTIANRLPYLKELKIHNGHVEPEVGLELLKICFNHPNLVSLHCDFDLGGEKYPNFQKAYPTYDPGLTTFLSALEDDKNKSAESDKPAAGTQIQALALPKIHGGYPVPFLCALLKSHLPNLERFRVPSIGGDGPYKDPFKEAVAQGCPKLQHIECSWYSDDVETQEAITGIITACSEWGLKSFYCWKHESDAYGESEGHILETLLSYHQETLEQIILEDYNGNNCYSLGNIMYKCKNLKKLKIAPRTSSDAGVVVFHHKIRKEWACSDLKELELTFDQARVYEDDDQYEDASEDSEIESDNEFMTCTTGWGDGQARHYAAVQDWTDRMSRRAYGRIGELSKLETLRLSDNNCRGWCGDSDDYVEHSLTLRRGWLSQLDGLKELRHFAMGTDFWSKMDLAEIKFMNANWPKLEKISFRTGSEEDLEDILGERHWKWLKETRPYLQFCRLE